MCTAADTTTKVLTPDATIFLSSRIETVHANTLSQPLFHLKNGHWTQKGKPAASLSRGNCFPNEEISLFSKIYFVIKMVGVFLGPQEDKC